MGIPALRTRNVPSISSRAVGLLVPIPRLPAGAPTVPVRPLPNMRFPILSWFDAEPVNTPAEAPMTILELPVVRPFPAIYPIAILPLPVVVVGRAWYPSAVLRDHKALLNNAWYPIAVLSAAVPVLL